eukprot:gene17788-biopygen7689
MRSRCGADEEQMRSRCGADEEQMRSRCGADEEQLSSGRHRSAHDVCVTAPAPHRHAPLAHAHADVGHSELRSTNDFQALPIRRAMPAQPRLPKARVAAPSLRCISLQICIRCTATVTGFTAVLGYSYRCEATVPTILLYQRQIDSHWRPKNATDRFSVSRTPDPRASAM